MLHLQLNHHIKYVTLQNTQGDLWPVFYIIASVTQKHVALLSELFLQQKKQLLTQNICGSVPGDEARVVPIAHPFLQDAFTEIFAEAAARRHQAVVAAVCLRESTDDSSGNQSTVRQHGQHHQLPPHGPAKPAAALA